MPEVILPCPECGDDECLIVIKELPSEEWSVHCGCGHAGRYCASKEYAIKAHNALPRALRWTNEPPKVAGWYWYQLDGHAAEPRKIDSSFDGEEYLGVRDGWYVNRITKKPHVKWAGPIAQPIE